MLFSTVICLSAIAGALALPQPSTESSSLPKCKNKVLTFDIKVQSLLDTTGNVLPSSANGQFLVNVGGPAGFSSTASSSFKLSAGILTEVGTDNVASVKTTVPNQPHVGDIVLLPAAAAGQNGWPLITCTNNGTQLACAAGTRNVFQVCGKFVNVEAQANSNCQDKIAFDVVPTCKLS